MVWYFYKQVLFLLRQRGAERKRNLVSATERIKSFSLSIEVNCQNLNVCLIVLDESDPFPELVK